MQTHTNPYNKEQPIHVHKFKVYMWVVSFLRNYKLLFALLLLAGGLVSSVSLIIPKFIQHVIDVIVPSRDTDQLLLLIGGLVPFIIIVLLATAAQNMLRRNIQEKASRDLQLDIFQHFRKLGFPFFEKNAVGETLSMFQTEVQAVQRIYRQYLPYLIQKVTLLAISSVILVSMNLKLSLLIIPCFLSYYLVGPFFEKRQTRYAKEGIRHQTIFNRRIYDSLSALLELRVHRAEAWDLGRLTAKHDESRQAWLTELLYALLRGTARRFTINFGALFLFLYGASVVRAGEMSVGEFVAFLFYYFIVMANLTHVITAATEQRMLMIQAEKLYRFVHQTPDVTESMNPVLLATIRGELKFQDVSFGYSGDRSIVREISLHIHAGERIALVGTSGGGKTTLLKLIGRFYDPVGGTIQMDGVPLQALSFEQLRGSIGYVFQETYLFGSSVMENIRFGNPDASDDEVKEAAKSAYAHGFIEQLPQGYDTHVGERGIKLSGGQKQRVAIARMLLKNPSVILLDEATSALDNESEKEVQSAFEVLCRGKTTIAVAHRLSTIRNYDRIVVMEQGGIAEIGSYDELIERKGALYDLVQGRREAQYV